MNTENLVGELDAARRAGAAAAAVIRREFRSGADLAVRNKGHQDYVTRVDLECEALIRDELRAFDPTIGFLGEEGGQDLEGRQRIWVVDPLDGTSNFMHGFPAFAVSIALAERVAPRVSCGGRFPGMAPFEPILGVIVDVCLDEEYFACRGSGAWVRRTGGSTTALAASERPELPGAFLATGFPVRTRDLARLYTQLFVDLLPISGGIRRAGSAALDLAYTAAGVFDAFFEIHLSPWDLMAGVVLVREAGGVILAPGMEDPLQTGNLIAGSSGVCRELKAHLDRRLG
jgi:myo-inositol-1(or 4)-monophosphatase